ncbi:MAG: biotin--[acetyl-CoA-carboxylase] ligase [Archaeoglobaceae archaeon]
MRESFLELRIKRGESGEGEAFKFAGIAFKNLEFLEEFYYYFATDSTNERAKGGKIFSLFFAEEQLAGKGRLGRQWISKKGGLYFSLVLPLLGAQKLTILSALSVAESIPDARIKWPNDVLYKGKKFCGILGEVWENKAILGIGVNVENEIPPELRDYATNLSNLSMGRKEVFDRITRNFYRNYLNLITGNWEEIIARYRKICETSGKRVKIITHNREIVGIAEICEDGSIIVDGKRIYAGECVHLRNF